MLSRIIAVRKRLGVYKILGIYESVFWLFYRSVYKRLWSQCLILIGLTCCVFAVAMRAKGNFLVKRLATNVGPEPCAPEKRREGKRLCMFFEYRQMSYDVIRL